MPEISEGGISIKNGKHLLIDGIADPVSYGLGECADKGDKQSIALLTGANSGGKTTMLELLAHCSFFHMGLPVPLNLPKLAGLNHYMFLLKQAGHSPQVH